VLFEPAEGQLAWGGERCEPAKVINITTYEDHRMAMAFAPAAMVAPLSIEEPHVVSKSYPNFWSDFDKISV
jgi:3-phosphoshikimate 1-carboxyvinyltransferase